MSRDRFAHYVLDGRRPVVEPDLLAWGRWCGDPANRRVAETDTKFCWISTVFLGLDHNFADRGPPLLFETMVFPRESEIREFFGRLRRGLGDEEECHRYATWDDAEAGHAAAVRRRLKLEADALRMAARCEGPRRRRGSEPG